jgi:hypothetical protein
MAEQRRCRCHRSNCVPPRIDLDQVGGKNDERSAREPPPSFIEGWRNGCQQGNPSLDRCSEGTREAVPDCFELPEFAQQNEIAPCRNIALHRLSRCDRSGSVKVARGRARAQVVEYRKPFSGRGISQKTGIA